MYAGIYVKDVENTAIVLTKAFNAKSRVLQPNLVELTIGKDRLILNQYDMKGVNNAPTAKRDNTVKELELGIWVDNLDEVHRSVSGFTNSLRSNIKYVSQIEERTSGLKDFRFKITEGYYIRVTANS